MVVVSPHADDAAYSIGGLIQKSILRSQVHIVTLFGRSNYLRKSGIGSDPDKVTRLRQREDESFAARIGAALTYLDFPEAALRIGPAWKDIFAGSASVKVPEKVKTTVSSLFDQLRPRCLFAPLAVGGHRDHLITRDLAAGEARRRALPLFYYEDLPYVTALTPQRVRAHVRLVDPRLQGVFISIDLGAKLNTLTLYRSQIGGEELQLVSRYALQLRHGQPAERLWTVRSQVDLIEWFAR